MKSSKRYKKSTSRIPSRGLISEFFQFTFLWALSFSHRTGNSWACSLFFCYSNTCVASETKPVFDLTRVGGQGRDKMENNRPRSLTSQNAGGYLLMTRYSLESWLYVWYRLNSGFFQSRCRDTSWKSLLVRRPFQSQLSILPSPQKRPRTAIRCRFGSRYHTGMRVRSYFLLRSRIIALTRNSA